MTTDTLTLRYGNQVIRRIEAEEAAQHAYRYFTAHTEPRLSPLTILSYAIRHYNHIYLDAYDRQELTDNGFLVHGEKRTLKERLRLPGKIAVALVVPEIYDGSLSGEYLEEPFKEARYLDKWYKETHPPRQVGTKLSWIRTAI